MSKLFYKIFVLSKQENKNLATQSQLFGFKTEKAISFVSDANGEAGTPPDIK